MIFKNDAIKKESYQIFICCILLLFYYLLFLNRGLVLGDEGYSVHIAERILQRQIPYRDFFLQYPPGYFYLLAGLFKLFGKSIIVGRLLSLSICVAIFIISTLVLKEFNITSVKSKIIILIIVASFGFPLINIPVVVWPTVLLTELVMLWLLKWNNTKSNNYLFFIGISLTLLFLIKQNIALTQILFVNIILFIILTKKDFKRTISVLSKVNIIWIIPTFIWIYIFFLNSNITALFEFISFNRRYLNIYPFTYPPLSFLLQPLGFFKLLPYYLPILFFIYLFIHSLKSFSQKSMNKKLLVLFLPLSGFITTVFPTSDLLHVYPYLGPTLIAIFIFVRLELFKYKKFVYALIVVCIASGFYLTFIREYYRYQPPYRFQTMPLKIPRAQNILLDINSAQSIRSTYAFIDKNTNEDDKVFVYSFSPMLYFLLERENPSRYSIYYRGYLTKQQEEEVLRDIKNENVEYVLGDGYYNSSTPISLWIKDLKVVRKYPLLTVYTTK